MICVGELYLGIGQGGARGRGVKGIMEDRAREASSTPVSVSSSESLGTYLPGTASLVQEIDSELAKHRLESDHLLHHAVCNVHY